MKYLVPLLFLLIISPVSSAFSQVPLENPVPPSEVVPDRSYMANPRYDAMVRAAMMNMSDTFKFNKFRELYADTSQFDPIGDDVINEMQRLAYIVQNGETAEKKAKALDRYRNLVMLHMANIRIVAQALSFAKMDGVFGSVKFFSWIRKGLVREIMAGADGMSLRSAYNVMTLTEETVLLGQLGVSVLDTQSAHEGSLYYNMHEVEDLKTGQKSTIFVNTTRPMRFLNYKYKKSGGGNKFIMPRQ